MKLKMKSKKVLFRNYLIVIVAVVFITIVLLGSMMMYIFSEAWLYDQKTLLMNNAVAVTDFIQEKATFTHQTINFEKEDFHKIRVMLKTISEGHKADVIVSDNSGNIVVSTRRYNSSSLELKLIEKIYLEETYFDSSNLDNFFDEDRYIVAIPIQIAENGGYINKGVVVCASPERLHTSFVEYVFMLMLVAVLISFVILLVISVVFSYSLTKPLKQMIEATVMYSRGDFSKRLEVGSNDEIGQLQNAINNMAISLDSLENGKNNFISNVSHELKTPMTTISGFVDGILDGTIKSEEQTKYLSIVSMEIKRLSRLVQSMISLSKIGNGELKLKYSEFDLTETVINIVLSFEMKLREREIEVIGLDKLGQNIINADKDLMYQAIYNLVENASKFTNIGGYIDIALDYEKEYNIYILKIKNTGEGIKHEELIHIFDKFYKTDKSRSMDKNGMGLGLYLVKTIVNLHNGQISVDSVDGEYCEFIIEIPKNAGSIWDNIL